MALTGCQAVKVLSPEMLSLLECAEALFIDEGYTPRRVRGVSDNWSGVAEFRRQTMKALFWVLNRRSQRLSFSWRAFVAYVSHHGLAVPGGVANLNPAPYV